MKKLILAVVSLLCMILCFACASAEPNPTSESDSESVITHTYVKHDAVTPDCENAGNEEYYTCSDCNEIFDANKNVIAEIPTIVATGHSYKLNEEVEGNCSIKGAESHYECTTCNKIFDLLKNEIESVEGDYDLTKHVGEGLIAITSNPNKLTYFVGESFDPTGLVIAYKCSECAGETIDNSRLTFEHQTVGSTVFAAGDTKITVKYGEFSVEIAVTVENVTVEISNVLDSYTTSCGTAPVIEAISNVPALEIFIDYYDEEGAIVIPSDFVEGSVYTAVLYVESAEGIDGAEVETTIYVEHNHVWATDSTDENKRISVCGCGDKQDFYALDNQEYYVDSDDMSIDLSKLVVGTSNVSVVEIMQVKDGTYFDIVGANDGLIYEFDVSNYETHNPYKLTLLVTFEIEGTECVVSLVSKYVDKVIREAKDLLKLAYTGAAEADKEGAFAAYDYYVLAGDIDATDLVLSGAGPAWQASIGFCGTFDGLGYTISNLTIPDGSHGLFGSVGLGAVIKNVNFENVISKQSAESSITSVFAFAIRNATLSNVNVEFGKTSLGFRFANEINDTVLDNVSATLLEENTVAAAINNCEGEIDCTYWSNKIRIKNAEDLLQLAYTGSANSGDAGAYANTAYYVLAGNIDATGLVLAGAGPAWQAAIGFRGTFDGQGYTISNLTIPDGSHGLFGAIGLGAVIKNVNFENVISKQSAESSITSVFAFAIRNATLSNVNVEFGKTSLGFRFANEINDTVLDNVSATLLEENTVAAAINNCEGEIEYNYWTDKIYIRNAEDLLQLAYTGTASAGGEGAYANSAHYVLASNIDATGLVLTGACPAWQAAIGFCGTFDGQGYTISNLTVPAWSQGLFGAVGYGAVIKNVKFENLVQGEGGLLFAHAIRNATLSNVTVSFSADSVSYTIANEINDSTFDSVKVITRDDMVAAGTIARCEGEIAYEYTVGKIVIRNAEDLLQLAYTGPASAGDEGAYANSAHYVLAGNIDATGLVLTGAGPAWQAAIGFCGTFDGQGYTISNLTVPAWSQGLFGAVGYGAVIKNVKFENLVQGEGGLLFAHAIRNATLSNVTVSFSADSVSYKIANEINDTTIENVNVLTAPEQVAAGAFNNCTGEVVYSYFVEEE